MSPSRHNPNPQGRRPRVAGLRKPGESPQPSPRPRPEPEDAAEPASQQTEPPEHAEESQHSKQPQQSEQSQQSETEAGGEETGAGTHVAGTQAEPGAEDSAAPDDSAGDSDESVAQTTSAQTPSGKPSPRRKPPRAGTGKPVDEQELTGAAEPGAPPARLSGARAGRPKKQRSRKRSYFLAAGLVLLAAVFATGAVFAKIGYSDIAKATDNSALLEVNKTQKVKKAMTSAAERLFSVDYRHIDKSEKAAKELLASKDVKQTYTTLMGEVKRLAPKQKIVVTVNATEAAVVRMEDDQARVVVYVDQASKRSGKQQAARAGAALWFQTELRDGEWKVVDMDTYSSGESMGNGKQQNGQQGGQQGRQQGSGQSSSNSSEPSSSDSSGN